MTPKQMYSELAKIAGFRCASGETFVRSTLVSETELRKAQRGILALLDKLNAGRSMHDFRLTEAMESRIVTREARQRMSQDAARLRQLASSDPSDSLFNVSPGWARETVRPQPIPEFYHAPAVATRYFTEEVMRGLTPSNMWGDQVVAQSTTAPSVVPDVPVGQPTTQPRLVNCGDPPCMTCPHPTVT